MSSYALATPVHTALDGVATQQIDRAVAVVIATRPDRADAARLLTAATEAAFRLERVA